MPRGRPRLFDEEKALEAALHLFWRHGYEGTSIAMLAHTMGMTVPSLYNAFGNKESLFMRAVGRYDLFGEKLYDEAFAKTSPREVAQAILMGEVELVSGTDTPEGCLMVQGVLATGPESEPLRQEIAKQRRQAEVEVAKRFEDFQRAGQLPQGWQAAPLAAYVMAVATGIAVQAKGGASRQELIEVVHMAMRIWPQEQD